MPNLGALLFSRSRPFRRRSRPGALPGMVMPQPDSPPPRIHVIRYAPEEYVEQDVADPDDLGPLLSREGVTWINVDGLGDAKILKRLGEIFELHPLALEDVVNVHQRPKVEEYAGHLFIVARMASLAERLETEQIGLFLAGNVVLTFQERAGDSLDPVRERIRKDRGRIRRAGADYLVYALLDAVIDGYFPVMEAIGDRLDRLETEMIEEFDGEIVRRIHHVHGDLRMLRRVIWPHREAVNALLRDMGTWIGRETQLFLRDCYDHTVQLMDVAETYRELCADLRDYHFSQLSQRSSDIMKVLTIIATIFIPLSFVAGVYGMNFDPDASPWNMPELNWQYGYPYALALMASVAGVMLIFFWRRGWIGK